MQIKIMSSPNESDEFKLNGTRRTASRQSQNIAVLLIANKNRFALKTHRGILEKMRSYVEKSTKADVAIEIQKE